MSESVAHGPVALRCSLDYKDADTFMARYGRNLSARGIFLPAREPPAVGSTVRFEVMLTDGKLLLRGEGVVTWRAALEPAQTDRLHGMAIRFQKLDAESRAFLDRVVAHKLAHPAAFFEAAPDLTERSVELEAEAPRSVHSESSAPTTVAAKEDSAKKRLSDDSRVTPSPGAERADGALHAPKSTSEESSEVSRRLEALLSKRR